MKIYRDKLNVLTLCKNVFQFWEYNIIKLPKQSWQTQPLIQSKKKKFKLKHLIKQDKI